MLYDYYYIIKLCYIDYCKTILHFHNKLINN